METESKTISRDNIAHRLSLLLSESPSAVVERERTAFDRLAHPLGDRMVLFGAGGLGRRTLANLRRIGIQPLAFADNNPALWETSLDGVPVYSTAKAAELHALNAVFVVTIWSARASDRMSDRVQQLLNLGCKHVAPAGFLFWKFPDVFLPYYPLDLPHKVSRFTSEIEAAFDLLEDEPSRREFVAQVAFRLFLDYDGLMPRLASDQYFPPDLIELRDNEVLVDCGAFDGDSIADFVDRQGNSFECIIAFEPDAASWEKLHHRLNRYPESVRKKIHTIPQAVGAKTGMVSSSPTGTDQSKVGVGINSVQCVTWMRHCATSSLLWSSSILKGRNWTL